MYFRRRGLNWSNSTGADNRAELAQLAQREPAPGLVGYRDGRAIGWVSLAPREDYERLTTAKLLAPVDARPVWSIVCFVVSRRARGSGVAAQLLEAAIDYAAAHGATTLEAYPVSATRGQVAAADAYHGTQSMFEKQGFRVVETRQWNATTPVRPIMRRELDPHPHEPASAR